MPLLILLPARGASEGVGMGRGGSGRARGMSDQSHYIEGVGAGLGTREVSLDLKGVYG